MTNIEAILKVLTKEIQNQQFKMAETKSHIDTEKLDCLTNAKYHMECFIRLSKAN